MNQQPTQTKMLNVYTVIEILLLCGLAVFLVLLLRQEPKTEKSIEDLQTPILKELNLDVMQEGADQDVKRVFGLNAEDYDGICYYMPSSEMDVCELLLVKLKDNDQKDAVVSAAQVRLDTQKQNFDGYGTNQTALLEDAIIDTAGGCVLYVVAENPQAADDAFHDAL